MFQVHPLPAAAFAYLSRLTDEERAARNIQVHVSDGAFPCRVSLADAEAGEKVFLLHYEHQPNATPYRASHAIFVKSGAVEGRPEPGEVPVSISSRLLSVRAFSARHEMVDADIAEGENVAGLIDRMLGEEQVDYIHLHYARRGCFAARVTPA